MKLEIKDPCHEDWNKMKIGVLSRHCAVCDKGVMDFTKMNRAEIITYILSNPNEQVCGRLNRDQFDFHHTDIPILIETLKHEKTPNPFLVLALVCLSLSSCAQEEPNIQVPPAIEVMQGQVALPPDTTQQNVDENGDVIEVTTGRVKGNIVCEVPEIQKMGEVEPVQMLGDVDISMIAGGISIVEETVTPEETLVRQFAQEMPEFIGGIEALEAFVKRNLQYPSYERKNGIQGNVYVRFVVEADGRVTRPEILQTVPGSRDMDKEVMRLIKMMPKWKPGSNDGKKIPVYMSIPIQFKIN